jgi:hypothetical protein
LRGGHEASGKSASRFTKKRCLQTEANCLLKQFAFSFQGPFSSQRSITRCLARIQKNAIDPYDFFGITIDFFEFSQYNANIKLD